jgi:hypothetical protein
MRHDCTARQIWSIKGTRFAVGVGIGLGRWSQPICIENSVTTGPRILPKTIAENAAQDQIEITRLGDYRRKPPHCPKSKCGINHGKIINPTFLALIFRGLRGVISNKITKLAKKSRQNHLIHGHF